MLIVKWADYSGDAFYCKENDQCYVGHDLYEAFADLYFDQHVMFAPRTVIPIVLDCENEWTLMPYLIDVGAEADQFEADMIEMEDTKEEEESPDS